jgi:hypothetical protein
LKKSLLELEKHAQEGAKTFIEQTGEEHEPILLVETPEGIATGVFDDFNIDTFQEQVTKALREQKASGYVFVTEAWQAILESQYKVLNGEDNVSDLPPDDREEVIMTITVEKGKSPRVSSAVIVPTSEGRTVKKFRSDIEAEGVIEGHMVVTDW